MEDKFPNSLDTKLGLKERSVDSNQDRFLLIATKPNEIIFN